MDKVAVAMSGGVDSSVTAALLIDEGYEVIGVTMRLWECDYSGGDVLPFDGCCGAQGLADAGEVCRILGIPHHVANMQQIFEDKVVNNFCSEYSFGRTPNPCIRCNEYTKFGELLKWVHRMGMEFMATGHYARIEKQNNRLILKKGIDDGKDQSYFLCTMTQDQLKHTFMPLGKLAKKKVRQIATDLGLPVAEKKESQEICFVPDDDYRGFVSRRMPHVSKPGMIMNRSGKVVGEHRGIINYTIGQRKGLGIAAKEPLFVVAIDSDRNTVIVGSKQEVYGTEFTATGMNWIAFETLLDPIQAKARIRYRHTEAPAQIIPLQNGQAHVEFEEPQLAITPGQAVVFYEGDVVVGGGTIE